MPQLQGQLYRSAPYAMGSTNQQARRNLSRGSSEIDSAESDLMPLDDDGFIYHLTYRGMQQQSTGRIS